MSETGIAAMRLEQTIDTNGALLVARMLLDRRGLDSKHSHGLSILTRVLEIYPTHIPDCGGSFQARENKTHKRE